MGILQMVPYLYKMLSQRTAASNTDCKKIIQKKSRRFEKKSAHTIFSPPPLQILIEKNQISFAYM